MPGNRRAPRDVRDQRPRTPYLRNGKLHPREWKIACSAAGVLNLVVLAGKPWFVTARPVEVHGEGVHVEVVVRWLSSEVYDGVPVAVDDFPVDVVLEGTTCEVHTIH